MSRVPRPSLVLTLALPALAAIAVYLPALPGGFLSDDYSLLHTFYGADAREIAARVGKTFVSGVGPPSNQYRPLTMASFALNVYFSGADAAAWRLVNVLLHGANAALVALLAWQLAGAAARGARSAALAAGLAFAWFAPSAEAVAWIAARFDGMSLFWTLVAACTFLASEEWRDRYGLASLGATVLAFMSKESAAIAPALIVALAWVRRPRKKACRAGPCARWFARCPGLRSRARISSSRTSIFGDPFRFSPEARRERRSCPGNGWPHCPRAGTGGRSRSRKRVRARPSPGQVCCSALPPCPRACAYVWSAACCSRSC